MNIVSQILLFFNHNTPLIAFIGAIVGGEEVLIILSIYSADGTLNLLFVLIFFYLGVMVSDILWYIVGRSRLLLWITKFSFVSLAYNYWGKLLDVSTKKSDFQALFVTKFLYGFRIPTIMYLAKERLSVRNFLIYSLITNFIWVGVIAGLGWATGKGIKTITYFSHNIVLEIFIVGLIIIIFIIIMRWMSKIVKKWLTTK